MNKRYVNRLEQLYDDSKLEIATLRARIEALEALVQNAYREGWETGRDSIAPEDDWLESAARAALEGK